ncbi:kinase-like domain-containing protein [Rhizophagus irregularis DAOM 181602=DAOM 197198]|nr:kinase-like domain-containing protein [Rhizophagus irregularis DAOM 181602=DAOM 197198]
MTLRYSISDDAYEQIKDFSRSRLTEEQELLVDKLILNEEIKERYKEFGLCKGCKQPKNAANWCRSCYYKRFQEDLENWTSGN